MEAKLIRYGDYQGYTHLIQYISTNNTITPDKFRRFACTDTEFILVVVNETGEICMTAKINYLFKFSKQMSHDMIIQDLVYDPNRTLSVMEAYEKIFEFCREHEKVKGFQIDRRLVMMNHFLFAHELILKRYGVDFIEGKAF